MSPRAFHPALATAVLTAAFASPAGAQVQTEVPPLVEGAPSVGIERIQIHGSFLEGNLEGNAVDREVIVFLPPSYESEPQRRYPVVYGLHGYSIGAEQWSREIHVPQTIEGAFGLGAQDMIVVLPDSKTMHNGSRYSSSPTTGDFERFVAHDVVEYIDQNYRTIPERRSRGLVGHSMGGYGATRIGMKHADVFGSLYIMSPGLSSSTPEPPSEEDMETIEAMTSPGQSIDLPGDLRSLLSRASAWSPNPQNPPLYVDLAWEDGEVRPEILAKWTANQPLAFIDQYIRDLRRYDAISIDVGDEDRLRVGTQELSEVLDTYGVAHDFEIYAGDHTSGMAVRFQNHVMPFFSEHLCATAGCQ